ncbi:MAG: hypothetical protein IJK67_04710 [Bacilli bacterium]|nr:hypothetical protein [Bacilli bacterium]
MEKKKEKKLVSYIFEGRTMLALALLQIDNKKEYLERILEIKHLPPSERELWVKLKERYDITGEIVRRDLYSIFGYNRVNYNTIRLLFDTDVNEEIDKYLSYYENVMRGADIYETLSVCRNKLLEDARIDATILLEKIFSLSKDKSTQGDALKNLEKSYDEEVDKTKISTCIKKIDDRNATFRKGTVNAIMGYTGSYKTLYCTNVSYEAIRNKLNVCYISLEISRNEMYYNFLSRYSNEETFDRKISHSDMKFKELSLDDKDYLFHTIVPAFEELSKHLVIIDETDFKSNNSIAFDEIFRRVERGFIEFTGKGVDMVVIDHLNLLKFNDSNGTNDYSKVNHWMSYFRRNCKNFIMRHKQICILVAVQSSRDGYEKAKHNDGSYSLTGAAEGNEIERSSENVLAIYSDSDLKEKMQAKIQIIKGRNCGEMEYPEIISVNPKYYIVSDYNESDENQNENQIIDVGKVKYDEADTISHEEPNNMNNQSKIVLTEEKREQLSKLGVNLSDNSVEIQNQYDEESDNKIINEGGDLK